MRRPIWFRAGRFGLGWTPCAWQGWVVTGIFAAALLTIPVAWGGPSPGRMVITALALTALVVLTAVLTSESTQRDN